MSVVDMVVPAVDAADAATVAILSLVPAADEEAYDHPDDKISIATKGPSGRRLV